ncbi:MAG: universal stress protein [Algibacter sp.]|uniref:universal stress protein n=1 Tax=Algibacter sp. TaxID=1872428 RepID=UPI002606EA75|nr:universal stress protein [Algibacter sp.]MDG1730386.1 universal stress protein [Algibacter sp.]MDG2178864.1 universal stress protein [Algibacter sp.]
MKRKILLPTDFSKNAWHAIIYALELYKNEHVDFYILNVFFPADSIMSSLINMEPGSEMYETAKLNSENSLAKVMDMIAFRDYDNSKHHFETISKFNGVVEVIKNVVEEKDIELIIMGTKGKTDSKAKVFGGVAIHIMEKVRNCPVIVVPEQAKHHLPKEIVFPTSFKTHIKRRELSYLIDLTKNCNASIRILHVANENKLSKKQLSNKTLLKEYFEGIPHTFHTLSHIEIPAAIICFIESRESDMVAFINKKHAFFGSILSNPLVKKIGYESKVPIFVMHDLRN